MSGYQVVQELIIFEPLSGFLEHRNFAQVWWYIYIFALFFPRFHSIRSKEFGAEYQRKCSSNRELVYPVQVYVFSNNV